MPTIVENTLIGLEEVQYAAWRQLLDGLNVAKDDVATYFEPLDEEAWELQGNDPLDFVPTVVEDVEPQNFYRGHVQSLVRNAPIDKFPNCCVFTTQATPGTNSQSLDQLEAYRDNLIVEVMTKSEVNEQEVNRRALRTAEAVNITLQRDTTLGGTIHGFESAPNVIIGDVFIRKETTAYGPEWYWQGVRLEYAVRKEAESPSSEGSVFRSIDIDQV
jgi:small nuclear ribonucleoprotein (snRNP)-like protein